MELTSAFAETVGATSPDGTALVAIMNGVSVVGNTALGWVSDRVSARITVALNCTFAGLSVFILWGLGTSSGMLVAFSILWGFSALSFVALWSKLITRTCRESRSRVLKRNADGQGIATRT